MTKRRVSEAVPIQVYLAQDERRRLQLLAEQLDATKSDVLRRGLLALERELVDPRVHPALRLIGTASGEKKTSSPVDAARKHDDVLAGDEIASWTRTRKTRRNRP